MKVRHKRKIFNATEFRNLLAKFNFTPSDADFKKKNSTISLIC